MKSVLNWYVDKYIGLHPFESVVIKKVLVSLIVPSV